MFHLKTRVGLLLKMLKIWEDTVELIGSTQPVSCFSVCSSFYTCLLSLIYIICLNPVSIWVCTLGLFQYQLPFYNWRFWGLESWVAFTVLSPYAVLASTPIISFGFHFNPERKALLAPFYRWWNWGSKRLGNLPIGTNSWSETELILKPRSLWV